MTRKNEGTKTGKGRRKDDRERETSQLACLIPASLGSIKIMMMWGD
jgi:hypothetical protein